MKNKMMKSIITAVLVLVMICSMCPLTAHAAGNAYVTAEFDMPEGCTYPIFVSLTNMETFETYSITLRYTNDYRHVFTVPAGDYTVLYNVDGDSTAEYTMAKPIVAGVASWDVFTVIEGSNCLIQLAFTQESADKAVEQSNPPTTTPIDPTDPVTKPTEPDTTVPDVTEPEKQPGETKPETPPVDNNPSNGNNQQGEQQSPYSAGPFIRAGIFLAVAGVVAIVVAIKRKKEAEALEGDDD